MCDSNQNVPTTVKPGENPTCPSNGNVIAVPAPVKLNPAAVEPIKTGVKK